MKEYLGRCAAFTPEGDLVVGDHPMKIFTTYNISYEQLTKYSMSGDLVWDVDLDYTCGDLTVTPDGSIITCPYSAYKSLHIYNSHGIKLLDVPLPGRTLLRKGLDLIKLGSSPAGHEQSLFTNSKGDVYFRFDVTSDLLVLNMEGGFESGPKVLSRLEIFERVITGKDGVFASIDKNRMVIGSGRDLMMYEYKTKPSTHTGIPTTHGILEPLGLGMHIMYMLRTDHLFYYRMEDAIKLFGLFLFIIFMMVIIQPILILPTMVIFICGYMYLLNIL